MIGTIVALAHATPMVPIDRGRYTPLYGEAETSVAVEAFELDAFPVTNREYAAFLQKHPKWSRSRIASLFAEHGAGTPASRARVLYAALVGEPLLHPAQTPEARVTMALEALEGLLGP